MNVSRTELEFSTVGGTETIQLDTDGIVAISIEPYSWGHVRINGNEIIVKVDENANSQSCTDYFVVKSGNMEKRINISQDGSLATYLRLSESSIEASRSGTGYKEFYVVDAYTDSDNVTATTNASWIDVDVVGDRIKIETSKNTGSRRTATITVKADRQSKTIRISQKGISNCQNCYNLQFCCSTGQVWGIIGYYYIEWTPFPQYGWVQCPVCGGSGSIEN
ncbi:MAG: hypothetical protein NC335_00440 [Bacteroides sp.]|nr:hypothetical protein [Bacteroides sp.]